MRLAVREVCAVVPGLPLVFVPLVSPRAAVGLGYVFAATAEFAVDVAVRAPASSPHRPVALRVAGAGAPAAVGCAAAPHPVARAAALAAANVRDRGRNWRCSGKAAWVLPADPWDGSPRVRDGSLAGSGAGDSLSAVRSSGARAAPEALQRSPATRAEPSESRRFEPGGQRAPSVGSERWIKACRRFF